LLKDHDFEYFPFISCNEQESISSKAKEQVHPITRSLFLMFDDPSKEPLVGGCSHKRIGFKIV
jgi:hypothetical protein